MRAYLPEYDLHIPRNLGEALEVLADAPGKWKPFAGGTDLMVLLEAGKLPHKRFVSVWGLPELRGIEHSAAWVTLGALTTYTEVRRHPLLVREFPLLCHAAGQTGGIATQNRGTLGGNIANASPAADSPPALLVYDAELELASIHGVRWIPYSLFHHGYKQMDLRPDELIGRIRLSRKMRGWRQYYRKVGTRRAQAISKVCLAAAALLDGSLIQDVRISLGSVASTVLRATRVENILRGKRLTEASIRSACEELALEITPIDDMRSSGRYRRLVAQNLLRDFLLGLNRNHDRA